MKEEDLEKKQGVKKTETFDKEDQKDIARSEGEGYAIMYESEKKKNAETVKQKAEAKSGGKNMKVQDIMTIDPACCMPDTNLKDVAKMMLECDCGEIPVVDNEFDLRPLGVVTDRDIVCRTVAQGINPLEVTAKECMTQPCIMITPESSIEDCCHKLEEYQIRRIPVVDDEGACCGMISQADIAIHLREKAAEVLEEVSRPSKRF
jgi:CBS domain-containing protein